MQLIRRTQGIHVTMITVYEASKARNLCLLCLRGRAAIATRIAIGKPLPQARISAAECNDDCVVIGKLQMNARVRSSFLFLTTRGSGRQRSE